MMLVEILAGIAGGAFAVRPVWLEVREGIRVARLRRSAPSRRLRRQIDAQYRAEAAVRRGLALDPWLGRGGSLLFDPAWAGIERKGKR